MTLEEHFSTPDLQAAIAEIAPETRQHENSQRKLLDLGNGRVADMDQGGVDMQVLSLASSGFEVLDSSQANSVVQANDRAADAVRQHPTQFAALANVNLKDPLSASKELGPVYR